MAQRIFFIFWIIIIILSACSKSTDNSPTSKGQLSISVTGNSASYATFITPITEIIFTNSANQKITRNITTHSDIAFNQSQFLGNIDITPGEYHKLTLVFDASAIKAHTFGINPKGEESPIGFFEHQWLTPEGKPINESNKKVHITVELKQTLIIEQDTLSFLNLSISQKGFTESRNTIIPPLPFSPTIIHTPIEPQRVYGSISSVSEQEVFLGIGNHHVDISKTQWYFNGLNLNGINTDSLKVGDIISLSISHPSESEPVIHGANYVSMDEYHGHLRHSTGGLMFMGFKVSPTGEAIFIDSIEIPSSSENSLDLQSLPAGQKLQFVVSEENTAHQLTLFNSIVSGRIIESDDGVMTISLDRIDGLLANAFYPYAVKIKGEIETYSPGDYISASGFFFEEDSETFFEVLPENTKESDLEQPGQESNTRIRISLNTQNIRTPFNEENSIKIGALGEHTKASVTNISSGQPVNLQIYDINVSDANIFNLLLVNAKNTENVNFNSFNEIKSYVNNHLKNSYCSEITLEGYESRGDFIAQYVQLAYQTKNKTNDLPLMGEEEATESNSDNAAQDITLSEDRIYLEDEDKSSSSQTVIIGSVSGVAGAAILGGFVIAVLSGSSKDFKDSTLATPSSQPTDTNSLPQLVETKILQEPKQPPASEEQEKSEEPQKTKNKTLQFDEAKAKLQVADQPSVRSKDVLLSPSFDTGFKDKITPIGDSLGGTHGGQRFKDEKGNVLFIKSAPKRHALSEVFSSKLYQLAGIPVLDVDYFKLSDQQKSALGTNHDYAVKSFYDSQLEPLQSNEQRIPGEMSKGEKQRNKFAPQIIENTDTIARLMIMNAWIKETDSVSAGFNNVMYHTGHNKLIAIDLVFVASLDPTTSWLSDGRGFNNNVQLDSFLKTKTELDKALKITPSSPAVIDQLKFILSIDKKTLRDTLKTTYDYDDEEIDTMVDRLVYRRVAISINAIPNNIDSQDLHTYFTIKYGSNYPNSQLESQDKIAFDKNQKILLAMVPTNVNQEADDLKTLTRTYGKDFILFMEKMSKPHSEMLRRNFNSWLDQDIINADYLSAKQFIMLSQNRTRRYMDDKFKPEKFSNYEPLKKFYIKKFGSDFSNNIYKFSDEDLYFYNLYEEHLSNKPIKTDYASEEELITHLQNKYKRPTIDSSSLSDSEYDAIEKFELKTNDNNSYIIDSDNGKIIPEKLTEISVDDTTTKKNTTVLYFYSNNEPDNIFRNGYYNTNLDGSFNQDENWKLFTQEVTNPSQKYQYVYRIETQEDIKQLSSTKITSPEQDYRILLESIPREKIQSVKKNWGQGSKLTPAVNQWYLNSNHNKKYKR